MKRFGERLLPFLCGVAGSFWTVREFLRFVYVGERENFWSLLLCLAVWELVFTRACALPYLVLGILVILCPAFYVELQWPMVCLLFISYVILHGVGKPRAAGIAAGVLLLSLGVGGWLGYGRGEGLSERVFVVDRYVDRLYRSWNGMSEDGMFENGNVGRGNNYRSGDVQLDLAVENAPGEAVYLRGFEGRDYIGSRWTPADESDFYREMEELLYNGKMRRLQELQGNLRFILNYGSIDDWAAMLNGRPYRREGSRKLYLHQAGRSGRRYVPYYSFHASSLLEYYREAEWGEVEAYLYYEASEMDPERMNSNRGYYGQTAILMLRKYGDYVEENYLGVDEGRLPRLAALCEAHPCDSPEEATEFIRETLQADTDYTRTPGITPVNQDVVEYFLFESKRGYCLHYASAATLMYRMYGIPARYVTGYVAYPADFEEQEDGSFGAALTDYRKHAWVEIYSEELGWTPVEMTPAAAGAEILPVPDWLLSQYVQGEDGPGEGVGTGEGEGSEGSGEVRAEEDVLEDEEEDEADQEEKDEDGEDEEEPERDLNGNRKDRGKAFPRALWGAVSVLGLAAALYCRRMMYLERLKNMEIRRIFYRLLKIVNRTKGLKGYRGTEEDFVQRLSEEFPALSGEEAQKLMSIVEEAAYGQEKSWGEEKREWVYGFYLRVLQEWRGRLNLLRRFFYDWIVL